MLITELAASWLFPIPSNESTIICYWELSIINPAKTSVVTSYVLGDALTKVDSKRSTVLFLMLLLMLGEEW